ncbi:MAG: SRPBCC domain-containing protein [Acidobacteriota bacterium]|nr:SRPBCC domain-containing protein [Acidobacteriota bacterium]
MATPEETRTIEIAMDIDAAVSRVWQALTDAEQLRRWFPLSAEVDPHVGGSIRLTWGPELDARNAIIAWESEHYLQTTWFHPTDDEPDRAAGAPGERAFRVDPAARGKLVLEFFLTSKGERTELRMVHSGFSRSPEWDEEYEAHSRGWTFELRSLSNYLEHHAGRDRHVAWVRRPIRDSRERAWSRLMSDRALLGDGDLTGLRPGDRYSVTTVHGDRLEGRVILFEPPTEFAGTVDGLDHALVRTGVERYVRDLEATFWLSTWGDPERAEHFRARWTETLSTLVG